MLSAVMARETQAASAEDLRSVNPATLEELGTVAISPPEEVAEAVVEARLAAERWAQSSFAERRTLLGAVAQETLARADLLAATVTAESGKPLVESYTAELFVSTTWSGPGRTRSTCWGRSGSASRSRICGTSAAGCSTSRWA